LNPPGSKVILTAHQPVYLPWLGLFHKIAIADVFVCYDDVQYQDRDWNNRNRIMTAAGPLWLSVPVFSKEHYSTKLKDAMIRDDVPWRRKHWRSLSLAYKDAPYAPRYLPFFEDLYGRSWSRLADLNDCILAFLLNELEIQARRLRLSDLGLEGQKSDLVLEMCRHLGASLYIFGAQGKNYADESAFREAGVRIEYQDYRHPVYQQLHGEFVSHLSVVDLLFNHGPGSRAILMSGNISREDLIRKHFASNSP
jgi:hypothetical protein